MPKPGPPPVPSPPEDPKLEPAPPAPPPPLPDPTTIDSVAVDPVLGVLANTVVTLERSGKVMAKTTTDAEGKFRFTDLPTGPYEVWAVLLDTRILVLEVTIEEPTR